jgi:outer membrane protein TolC
LLLAQREALTRAAAAAEANGALQLAWSRWRTYTGLGELPADPLEAESAEQDAGADHPGLVALQSAADRAGAERDRTRSEQRANPTLSLGARHERGNRGEPWNDAIAVGLDVPLGLPSQSGPARSAAEYAYTEATVERQRRQLALAEALTAARAELDSARAALTLLRDARTAAQGSLERAQAAFDLGEETLMTLLQVRTQALDAAMRCEEMELRVGRGIAAVNQARGLLP